MRAKLGGGGTCCTASRPHLECLTKQQVFFLGLCPPPPPRKWGSGGKYQRGRWGWCSLSASLLHTGRAEQMDSHHQQQEPPRATAGVEDKASGPLLRQTNLPPTAAARSSKRLKRSRRRRFGGEGLLRLALLLDGNELYFTPQAVRTVSGRGGGVATSAISAAGVPRKGRMEWSGSDAIPVTNGSNSTRSSINRQ